MTRVKKNVMTSKEGKQRRPQKGRKNYTAASLHENREGEDLCVSREMAGGRGQSSQSMCPGSAADDTYCLAVGPPLLLLCWGLGLCQSCIFSF